MDRTDTLPIEVETAADFAMATGADESVIADLQQYRSYLEDWNQKMNLVGPSTLDIFWSRHAWDSAQILPLELRQLVAYAAEVRVHLARLRAAFQGNLDYWDDTP